MKGVLALLGATLALVLPQVATSQTTMLEPAGEWEISSDAESCTLVRSYSENTRLFIRTYGPQSPSQISIVGPTMLRDDSAAKLISIGFDSSPPRENMVGIATSFEGQPMLVFQLALPRPGENPINGFVQGYNPVAVYVWMRLPASAQELVIDAANVNPQSLRLGDLQAPLQMLVECENELVSSWGFAATDQPSERSIPVLTNPDQINNWITYPPVLIRNHTSRIAPLRLRIGASGEVEGCLIQSSSWNRELMAQACRTITRSARFEPAVDTQGNGVAALWRASILFMMIDQAP